MIEFKAWPKLPRLNRNAVVTEKIDGTNAAVGIKEMPFGSAVDWPEGVTSIIMGDERDDGLMPLKEYWIYAQSRNKLITPGKKTDNAGFAGWVQDNASQLLDTLGTGLHFGEWWGKGIQRGYGLDHKRFSLFNTAKWERLFDDPVFMDSAWLSCVPVLTRGTFWEMVTFENDITRMLVDNGSKAAPGYMKPEGFCVFHEAANLSFKVTLDNDGISKTQASAS